METHGHATTLGHRAPHSLPLAATLGALGIVYGDIGTSPLYAFKEAAKAASGHAALEPGAVLGVLSLMLWALILVVSLKYAILILRADNRGEGGIMAMLALLHSRDAPPSGWRAHSGARPDRGGASLRRRRDHASDFGAERRRGLEARRAATHTADRADHGRHPDGSLLH